MAFTRRRTVTSANIICGGVAALDPKDMPPVKQKQLR